VAGIADTDIYSEPSAKARTTGKEQPGHPQSAEMPKPRKLASATVENWLSAPPICRNLCFTARRIAHFDDRADDFQKPCTEYPPIT
jgi:hypothetical protein